MDFRKKFARDARRSADFRINRSWHRISRGTSNIGAGQRLYARLLRSRDNAFAQNKFAARMTKIQWVATFIPSRRRRIPISFKLLSLVTRYSTFPVRPCEPGCENFPTSFFVRDPASVVSSFFSEKVLTTLRLWKITTEFFVNEILNFFCRFFVINFKCSNNVRSN